MRSKAMSRNITFGLIVISLFFALVCNATAASSKPGPAEALAKLKDGNARFIAGNPTRPRQDKARLMQAGSEDQGDHAYATVITCSDSRVPVELIFDAGIMDLFVIRVAGNVMKGDEAGSIEYGLCHVNTPVLVVLGHTQCGAVTAVTQSVLGHGHPLETNIPSLVAPIIPAVKQAMRDHPGLQGQALIQKAIVANVWQGIKDLFMQSPSVRGLVQSGKAMVVGAIYDVGSGRVKWLDREPVARILREVETDPERVMN